MSSYVSFRDKGFWLADGAVRLWASLLAEALRTRCSEPWAHEYASFLDGQATSYQAGGLRLGLDEFVTDDARKQSVLGALKGKLQELATHAELSMAHQRRLPHLPGDLIIQPISTNTMLRVATATMLLLEGYWEGDEGASNLPL